jgi:hypothetical protein
MFTIAGAFSFALTSPFNMLTSTVNKTVCLIVLERMLPVNELHYLV